MDGPKGRGFQATENRPDGFQREQDQWYLDMDTSDVGTRDVLSQMKDGEEWVVAYVSK